MISGIEYTYDYREQHGSCSLDFLTGAAVVNGKKTMTAKQVLNFATATDADVLKACDKLMGL